MSKKIILTCLALSILGGCSTIENTMSTTNNIATKVITATEKTQNAINLTSIKGKEFYIPKTNITITFDLEKFYGCSGINRYFGTYKIENGQLRLMNIGGTMMAGAPTEMIKEREYLEFLNSVTQIKLDGKNLILGNGKDTVVFTEK